MKREKQKLERVSNIDELLEASNRKSQEQIASETYRKVYATLSKMSLDRVKKGESPEVHTPQFLVNKNKVVFGIGADKELYMMLNKTKITGEDNIKKAIQEVDAQAKKNEAVRGDAEFIKRGAIASTTSYLSRKIMEAPYEAVRGGDSVLQMVLSWIAQAFKQQSR